MNISYTYGADDIVNGTSADASEVMQDFNDIRTVLNGNIENNNIKNNITLNIKSVTVSTKVNASSLTCPGIILRDHAGTYSLKVKDSNNNELFKIDSAGDLTIPLGKDNLSPVGTIKMWDTGVGGAWTNSVTIPGWYKCDGNNGTPNLVEKFVRGSTTSGQTGGSANTILPTHTHTHSIGSQSVSHNHSYNLTVDNYTLPSHRHSIDLMASGGDGRATSTGYGGTQVDRTTTSVVSGSHNHSFALGLGDQSANHTHTVTINNSAAETGINKNSPAYRDLIYIMKVN